MKKISLVFVSILFLGIVAGCSSPEEKAASYIASADTLYQENELDKAMLEYRNALQINQNLPDAWYGIARIHERRQQWKQAYGALSRIRDTNPDHVNGRIMLAQLLLASNQIDQALEDANHVLELAPEDARVHSLMAAVQFRLGNIEAANQSVEKALELDADNRESVLVKARLQIAEEQYDEALATLNDALQTQPDNASLYLMKLQTYAQMDDQQGIDSVYQAMVENFPDNLAFKHALVRRLVQQQRLDEAERLLEQIVEQNPDRIESKQRLVSFKGQYRSVDDAIGLIKEYIEQDPSEYQFKFMLAEIYMRNANVDEATAIYQGIIADDGVKPNGLEARNKLALIHLRSGKPDEAKVLVDEVLANDKVNENALVLQAGFDMAAARYDDAIIGLRTVLRDNPTSIRALGLIGQAYSELGSTELALEAYAKAFAQSPQNATIANSYARLLMGTNDAKQADEVLLGSIAAGNTSVQAVKQLTQVKLMLGEWDAAEELAQQLKNTKGEEAVSEQVLGMVYQGREQTDESIDAFKRAHELAPQAAQPVVALVRTYVQNGKQEEARQFLKKILSENDENLVATTLLGQMSMAENDIPAASGYFKRAIEINPKLDTGYRSLATAHMRENDLDAAERVLMDGLEQIPGNTTLSVSLASIYQVQEKFEQAIDVYEELLQKNSGLIVAKNNLASILTDHREDQASLERARRLAADFRTSELDQFRDTYAWANVRAGINLEEATNILEEIVDNNQNVGIYRYHLGEALRKKGDVDNARVQLNKVLELEREGSSVAARARESLQLVSQ